MSVTDHKLNYRHLTGDLLNEDSFSSFESFN